MADNYLIGIDIGSSKVCTVIGQIGEDEDGKKTGIEVIGYGIAPSRGIKNGKVNNIKFATEDIKKSVGEAELMSGVKVQSVYVNISGNDISSCIGPGSIVIGDDQVTSEDKEKAVQQATNMQFSKNVSVIHKLPLGYTVDGEEETDDPEGLSGSKMEVRVAIITKSTPSKTNLQKCLKDAGLTIDKIVINHLASGEGVLRGEEKQHGVLLIDIGANITDYTVSLNGKMVYARTYPVGGKELTNDLIRGFGLDLITAEKMKRKFGCFESLNDDNYPQTVEVPIIGTNRTRELNPELFSRVLSARLEKVFLTIRDALEREGLLSQLHYIILTGGVSGINNIDTIASRVFKQNVRIGRPQISGGLSDRLDSGEFSTAIGLLRIAYDDLLENGGHSYTAGNIGDFFKNIWEFVLGIFKEG